MLLYIGATDVLPQTMAGHTHALEEEEHTSQGSRAAAKGTTTVAVRAVELSQQSSPAAGQTGAAIAGEADPVLAAKAAEAASTEVVLRGLPASADEAAVAAALAQHGDVAQVTLGGDGQERSAVARFVEAAGAARAAAAASIQLGADTVAVEARASSPDAGDIEAGDAVPVATISAGDAEEGRVVEPEQAPAGLASGHVARGEQGPRRSGPWDSLVAVAWFGLGVALLSLTGVWHEDCEI